jgi:hypothetical protein
MSVILNNLDGSGSIKRNSVSNYSYSEEVTSLEPSNLSGGTSQVNITGSAVSEDTASNTHPNSALIVNNTMELTDSNYGSIEFIAKKVSISNGLASVTGDTVMSRLNVYKTAEPHGGGGASLLSAIEYYCSLVEVVPVIDEDFANELDAIDVNYLGWFGNVWEHLKMLCAGVSASETNNVGIEMYLDGSDLVFRKAKTTNVQFSKISNENYSIDSFNSAKSVEVAKYATTYGVNQVVREQQRQGDGLFIVNENVSISDPLQVEAGSIVTKRFLINASLSELQQPVCVEQIFPLPYAGTTGQYVIVGNDDLPIVPAQWVGQGGSVTVSLTENPYEIEITVVAPPAAGLPTVDNPSQLTYAPYKIGVESSGEADYPALYIVGTGVFFEKSTKTYLTGADDEYTSKDSNETVDNIFITTDFNQSTRGIAAAQAVCGPNILLTQTVSDSLAFGTANGSVQSVKSNRFRTVSASYNPNSVSITAKPCATFADFEAKWGVADFSDFDEIALDPAEYPSSALKFNEFSVIPLMGA